MLWFLIHTFRVGMLGVALPERAEGPSECNHGLGFRFPGAGVPSVDLGLIKCFVPLYAVLVGMAWGFANRLRRREGEKARDVFQDAQGIARPEYLFHIADQCGSRTGLGDRQGF